MPRGRLSMCLTLLALASLAQARTGLAEPGDWIGEPTLISGTSRYDRGEWIYTDFVYDDYGADTVPGGQPNVVSLAAAAGDFRYPNGTTAAGNAADIVEVRARVAPNGADLEVRVLLQSILAPEVPALRVELDGVSSIISSSNAVVDAAWNTISFVLAGAAAGGGDVSLNVGAGLNDGSGGLRAGEPGTAYANSGGFTTGAPTDARLFDLAFNTRDLEGRGGAWNEAVQSSSLAAGNLAPFTQTIDVDALLAAATTDAPALTGYLVRLFDSRQDLGEGMAASFPQYRGRWQPYAVWVPSGYQHGSPVPLFLNMHSLSVHHNQYRGGSAPSASYKTFYEQFEEAIDAVVVTPLARGPDGWYEDEALVDTMEVWADALRTYTIDRERVFVGGYSMGGFGTYRLTTLMPDAFTSAVSIVGPPSNGIWAYPAPPTAGEDNPSFTYPQLENTRHIPFWVTQGVEDELVPFAGVAQQTERLRELGHEYRFALHPVADHLAFVYIDNWRREAQWLADHQPRIIAPRRITFKVRPASWASTGDPAILSHVAALAGEVGARLDGAYWVDDVVVATGEDVTGLVDLTSTALSPSQMDVATTTDVGIDGPSPYLLQGQDQMWEAVPTQDRLSGELRDITSLTIDLGRAGLSDAPDLSGLSVTGGPVAITFVRDGVVVGQTQAG